MTLIRFNLVTMKRVLSERKFNVNPILFCWWDRKKRNFYCLKKKENKFQTNSKQNYWWKCYEWHGNSFLLLLLFCIMMNSLKVFKGWTRKKSEKQFKTQPWGSKITLKRFQWLRSILYNEMKNLEIISLQTMKLGDNRDR